MQWLKNFFNRPPDGEAQRIRNATFAAVLLVMYGDHHLAMEENDLLVDIQRRLGFDVDNHPNSDIGATIAAVRAALANPRDRDRLLAGIATDLDTDRTRLRALECCREIARADGTVGERESAILAQLEGILQTEGS